MHAAEGLRFGSKGHKELGYRRDHAQNRRGEFRSLLHHCRIRDGPPLFVHLFQFQQRGADAHFGHLHKLVGLDEHNRWIGSGEPKQSNLYF